MAPKLQLKMPLHLNELHVCSAKSWILSDIILSDEWRYFIFSDNDELKKRGLTCSWNKPNANETLLQRSEHLLLYSYKNSDPSSCPYIHLYNFHHLFAEVKEKLISFILTKEKEVPTVLSFFNVQLNLLIGWKFWFNMVWPLEWCIQTKSK